MQNIKKNIKIEMRYILKFIISLCVIKKTLRKVYNNSDNPIFGYKSLSMNFVYNV